MFEDLEAKLDKVSKAAEPLVSSDSKERENFSGSVLLTRISEALRKHAKDSERTLEAFAEDLCDNGTPSEAKFVEVVRDMPGLWPSEGARPTEEQLKGAYTWIGKSMGAESVTFSTAVELAEQL